MEPTILAVTPAQEKTYQSQQRRRFYAAISQYKVSSKCRHLRRGEPRIELPLLASSLMPSLLVMGAVSRSGLKRMLIGHTAEHVLDGLSCDVLIVKPAICEHPAISDGRAVRRSVASEILA